MRRINDSREKVAYASTDRRNLRSDKYNRHFHAAGVPGRHELYLGGLNYKNIVSRIQELGYDGTFGVEYVPTIDNSESLKNVLEKFSK